MNRRELILGALAAPVVAALPTPAVKSNLQLYAEYVRSQPYLPMPTDEACARAMDHVIARLEAAIRSMHVPRELLGCD